MTGAAVRVRCIWTPRSLRGSTSSVASLVGRSGPNSTPVMEDFAMRTLSAAEIDQVSGGMDSLTLGGVNISGIEAGLALRNVLGATGVAFGIGYGAGTLFNAGYQAVSGDSLGTDLYQVSSS